MVPKRIFLRIVLACIGVAGWTSVATCQTNKVTSSLDSLTSPHLTRFTLVDTLSRRQSRVLIYKSTDSTLKIEALPNIDEKSAKQLEESGAMGIEALYASALSPYPGDISKKIVVDEKYRPGFIKKSRNGEVGSFYILFASERFGYGAGTADTVKFKSLIGWIYCKDSRTFYRLRYFGPLDIIDRKLETFFASFSCPSGPRSN